MGVLNWMRLPVFFWDWPKYSPPSIGEPGVDLGDGEASCFSQLRFLILRGIWINCVLQQPSFQDIVCNFPGFSDFFSVLHVLPFKGHSNTLMKAVEVFACAAEANDFDASEVFGQHAQKLFWQVQKHHRCLVFHGCGTPN